MDQKLFLEKLSEVAEWQWSDCIGETNRSFRSEETDLETPQYIKIIRYKIKDCHSQGYHYWKFRTYEWRRETFWVGRCQHCGVHCLEDGRIFKLSKTTQLANEAHNLLTGRPNQVQLIPDKTYTMQMQVANSGFAAVVEETDEYKITKYCE